MNVPKTARPCAGSLQALTRPRLHQAKTVRKAVHSVPASRDCFSQSDTSTEIAGAVAEEHLQPVTLRQVLFSWTTAACLGAASPCQAIVEEKLTGSPSYKPTSTEVGWEVIVGAVVATIPLIVASYEFGKRILIQRRCLACKGSGLISRGRYLRKCSQCGGFLPWQGWKAFFLSTANPGNGGPLRQPRGQTGIFYKVPPKQLEAEQGAQRRQTSQPTVEEPNAASDTTP